VPLQQRFRYMPLEHWRCGTLRTALRRHDCQSYGGPLGALNDADVPQEHPPVALHAVHIEQAEPTRDLAFGPSLRQLA
jgi:hypothetical protein